MRLMRSIALLAASLMAGAGRLFAPDLGRERQHARPSIPRDLPTGVPDTPTYRPSRRQSDPVLAEKYQAERRWRKALEWERQHKWRACLQAFRRGTVPLPAAYARDLAMRFPAPAG